MNHAELIAFIRKHPHAVQASVSGSGAPQAAVVGIAVTDAFEIVFDTLGTTRKMRNLRQDPRVALVVGWDDEQTLQLEGVADEPPASELERLKSVYFASFPAGVARQAWKDITYVRVRPVWARYSDYRNGARVIEFEDFPEHENHPG